jgi:hypothetical protein
MTSGRDSADIVVDRLFPFRQLLQTLHGTESSKFKAAQVAPESGCNGDVSEIAIRDSVAIGAHHLPLGGRMGTCDRRKNQIEYSNLGQARMRWRL